MGAAASSARASTAGKSKGGTSGIACRYERRQGGVGGGGGRRCLLVARRSHETGRAARLGSPAGVVEHRGARGQTAFADRLSERGRGGPAALAGALSERGDNRRRRKAGMKPAAPATATAASAAAACGTRRPNHGHASTHLGLQCLLAKFDYLIHHPEADQSMQRRLQPPVLWRPCCARPSMHCRQQA